MPDEFSSPPPSVRAQQILASYAAYKAQTQRPNVSGPTYAAAAAPTQTAREILAARDEAQQQQAQVEARQAQERQQATRVVTTIPTRDTTVFTPPPKPKPEGGVTISQPELDRTNALRAKQGLPPLETVTKVNVVKGTSPSVIIKPAQEQIDLRERLAELQGKVQTGTEAVAFLKFPFMGQKSGETSLVSKTTILDPLQFLGLESAAGWIERGVGMFKGPAEVIIKEGTKDIGLALGGKSEAAALAQREKEILANFNRAVSGIQNKGPVVYQTTKSSEFLGGKPPPTPPPTGGGAGGFTSTPIDLGTGMGRLISKEGGTAELMKPSTPPSTPPPPKPPTGTKEVKTSTGQVLLQVEKQITEQKPLLKQETVNLGKSKIILAKPKTKQETKAEQLTKQYETTLQQQRKKAKQKTEAVIVSRLKESQDLDAGFGFAQPTQPKFGQPSKQKQPQGLVSIFEIPTPTPTPTPVPTIPRPKIPTPTPPITPSPKPKPGGPPPTGETPQPFPGLIPPPEKPESKKKKLKGKQKYNFLGNVPVTGLTGVYKRQDIIYGTKRINKLVGSEVRETGKKYGGKFSGKTHKGLLGSNKKVKI